MTRSDTATLPLAARTSLSARLTLALTEARNRRRERHMLANLDPHLLRDIGLTPDQVRAEASKPFWRA